MSDQFRCLAVVAALCVVGAGLTVAPASARQSSECSKFRPSPIVTDSERGLQAPDQPITWVTDRATKKKPIVIEFDQEPAVWWYAVNERGPLVDGNRYFNVQVDTRHRSVLLYARLEWPLAAQEFDLYMYNEDGVAVAWSEAFNQAPAEATGDSGGPGFEFIAGYPSRRCEGFTLENNAMWATPQKVQLKLWLGPDDL